MHRLLSLLSLALATTSFGAGNTWQFDRNRLPLELRDAPFDRVSSGALLRLDQNGDLIGAPTSSQLLEQTSSSSDASAVGAALDGRVGANIRFGDDPSVLPDNQRAQAEPHIMRSRTDFDFVVATFQEGRFTNGGAIDCGYSTTHDGGLTWSRALLPGVTQAVGGPYFRATDPVVGIDLSNNVFINMDAATDTNFDHGDVVVSRSTDGGNTFAAPVVAYAGVNQNYFADKNWMAVNTFPGTLNPGRVLVTFTLFTNFSRNDSPSPLVSTFSDDQGQTWSNAQFITGPTSHMQGSQPLFLPNGKVALVYWNFTQASIPNVSERLEAITSDDGGATFGVAHVIGHINQWFEPSIRSGSFLPSAATDRVSGNLYVVCQANLGSSTAPVPKILFTKSTDGGNTWAPFIAISDNPTGSGVFNPGITVSPDGQTVVAAFYDRRDNPGSTTLVDMYEAQSFDGGATWQPNIRLTSVSTDANLAPLTASGRMLGDYLGVAEPSNVHVPAIPVFVDTRTGNPDPFVARIGIAPQFDFASWQAARLSLAQINSPQYGVHQLNISTRLRVEQGDDALIGGFIITGTESKKVIIRGIGPSLGAFGIAGTLQDPTLELHDGSNNNAVIAFNDNWQDAQATEIQASGVPPSDPREAAIIRTLPAGRYSAILRGKSDTTGVGLVEVYDLSTATNSQLANLSTRGSVQTKDNVMIGGFIVGGGTGPNGTGSEKVAIRALGPSLASAGVKNPLPDPILELHDSNGTGIFADDNWQDTQGAEIAASGFAPPDSRESVIIVTIPPGNYSAVVRGKNDSTGIGLVEVYNLQ